MFRVVIGVFFFSTYVVAYDEIFKFYEKVYDMPSNLLQAIAQVESGRFYKGKMLSWPWTVHAQGKGYYCLSREQAVETVNKLHQQGIFNIDVGCMQVNLKYHSKAFENLSNAFDPTLNIAYAASYLRSLYDTYKSWSKAVAYYHSRKPYNYQAYLKKVNQVTEALSNNTPECHEQGLVRFASYKVTPAKVLYKVEEDVPKLFLKPSLKVRSYRRILN
jgi:hypothetical protein